jgi:hypothetical protein
MLDSMLDTNPTRVMNSCVTASQVDTYELNSPRNAWTIGVEQAQRLSPNAGCSPQIGCSSDHKEDQP